jgi:hypothetical protein
MSRRRAIVFIGIYIAIVFTMLFVYIFVQERYGARFQKSLKFNLSGNHSLIHREKAPDILIFSAASSFLPDITVPIDRTL